MQDDQEKIESGEGLATEETCRPTQPLELHHLTCDADESTLVYQGPEQTPTLQKVRPRLPQLY